MDNWAFQAVDVNVKDSFQRVKRYWDMMSSPESGGAGPHWDVRLYPHIQPLSSQLRKDGTSLTTFALTVPVELCNRMNTLHGGCTATIFDLLTTLSIAPHARPGVFAYLGVTRTLNCTCLKPVPLGSRVRVECEVVSIGRRMVTIRGVMKTVREEKEWDDPDAEVLCVCEHGKANVDPEPKL